MSGEGSYIAAPQDTDLAKEKGKMEFKGLYDFNELQIQRQRKQH